MAAQNISYAHELAWHDGNGHSHVQAAIMGPPHYCTPSFGQTAVGHLAAGCGGQS
jgi:thiamine phosphate synthase YjbQ (UPF0047 family)